MKKIGVDDGHGTNTAGKQTPNGYKENEFNNACKQYLIAELKRNNFSIVDCSPTRQDNSLQNRCDIANTAKADIFISIHFNAMSNIWQSSAEGIETYFHGNSTNGKKLASAVHRHLLEGTKMNNRGFRSDFTLYSTGLAVLRETNMPAILVECGFMDNKQDVALMKSEAYRKECAIEICKGCCDYFNQFYIPEKITPKYKDAATILTECSSYPIQWRAFIIKLKSDAKYRQEANNLEGLLQQVYYHTKTL